MSAPPMRRKDDRFSMVIDPDAQASLLADAGRAVAQHIETHSA